MTNTSINSGQPILKGIFSPFRLVLGNLVMKATVLVLRFPSASDDIIAHTSQSSTKDARSARPPACLSWLTVLDYA
jgi:hypothetical protein